jgi:DNA helicase HerA-like ATPase
MAEELPAYPFEPERCIGTVVEIGPTRAKVNLPDAAGLDGDLRHGERPGGSGVGEFVVLDAGDVAVLARLTEIRVPERDRLSVEPKMGERRAVHPIGSAQLLTSVPLDGSPVERGVTRFPRVGARVHSLDPALITWIVQRVSDISAASERSALLLDLAFLPGTGSARVRVTPERLFGRHCAVLGATGSGKSWSVARVIERVAEFDAKGILLDATGEYHSLRNRVSHVSLGGEDLPKSSTVNSFPYTSLEERDLFALFQPAGKVQGPRLREAIKSLKLARILSDSHELVEVGQLPKANRPKKPFEDEYARHSETLDDPKANFDIGKLAKQIELECVWPSAWGAQRGVRDHSKWGDADEGNFSMCTTLVARIESDLSSPQFAPIFRSDATTSLLETIENFLADDAVSILRVSLRNLAFDRNVREIIANGIGRNLLRLAREGRFHERPLLVCLDEAHQFLNKELGDEFSRYPLDAFDLVAKEGRKYSLSICLATQRPRDIPNSVIGQMGTLLVHRLTNDKDRDMVERAAGELDHSAAEFLPALAPGQALLLGVEFPIPLTIQVSPPDAEPDSRGPNFQKHWRRRKRG